MLENEIAGLREDIRALTAALQAAHLVAPVDKPAPVKQADPTPTGSTTPTPVESGDAPVTTAPVPAQEPAAIPVDVEAQKATIRKLAIDVSSKHGSAVFMDCLSRFGVKTVRDLDVDQYGELIEKLTKVLAEGAAAV